ncbi:MAG: hypothetical protein A2849_00880 [Candidatus Taylorbacteria bacterium RIFCSPHIGHO2_01_FULL_51_15]|uniref:Uncharacterized protein n=1 Tax=Candidatus Taylorbacteria bacterium RIFCSPHIGHO2_01_FULL_51_15 TaxID=1802304 RepID=A0A1G2MB21_9BACT|nr:MAG: hypothetical protein A2849_00880 [Candidatus Taylorbacteria bacterium RIFCSPHIGHO2_01_FULL_51_15]
MFAHKHEIARLSYFLSLSEKRYKIRPEILRDYSRKNFWANFFLAFSCLYAIYFALGLLLGPRISLPLIESIMARGIPSLFLGLILPMALLIPAFLFWMEVHGKKAEEVREVYSSLKKAEKEFKQAFGQSPYLLTPSEVEAAIYEEADRIRRFDGSILKILRMHGAASHFMRISDYIDFYERTQAAGR